MITIRFRDFRFRTKLALALIAVLAPLAIAEVLTIRSMQGSLRASAETDTSLELRTRDRMRKLIAKIDEALQRIEDGSYGYCQETDEPIAISRLEARPIATLSLEAQERHERMEKTQRDG